MPRWLLAMMMVGLATGAREGAYAQALPNVIHPDSHGEEAVGRRANDGHFYFMATTNGQPIRVMFDTGAFAVALRAEDAVQAGIDSSALQFTARISTANGLSYAAPVLISSMTVGGITRHNVRAFVHRPGTLGVTLLGQSFLSRLSGFRVDGDRLVLQGEN